MSGIPKFHRLVPSLCSSVCPISHVHLSQWRAHWPFDGEHGEARKTHAHWRLHGLQKKVDHESSIYKGAKMPNMQRLTWSGIAMHAGNLPGYPASHGCVRLPGDFAAKLYTVTKLGTTVIIADNKSSPVNTTKPGLLFSATTSQTIPMPAGFTWTPEKAPNGPVSIIVST